MVAEDQIANDYLQLVRFGLRSPDGPAVRHSIDVTDASLRIETPLGLAWYRYNEDGYGEHFDDNAYDGTGVGRF